MLLRWLHPDRGEIAPPHFIAADDRIGVSGSLGEWTLRQACTEAAAWPTPLRLAVNVAPSEFANVALPDIVRSAVRDTGIDPRRLDVEITEAAVIDDVDARSASFSHCAPSALALSSTTSVQAIPPCRS